MHHYLSESNFHFFTQDPIATSSVIFTKAELAAAGVLTEEEAK
jgi:hypothetical protein